LLNHFIPKNDVQLSRQPRIHDVRSYNKYIYIDISFNSVWPHMTYVNSGMCNCWNCEI
jgi:hypothetical protein